MFQLSWSLSRDLVMLGSWCGCVELNMWSNRTNEKWDNTHNLWPNDTHLIIIIADIRLLLQPHLSWVISISSSIEIITACNSRDHCSDSNYLLVIGNLDFIHITNVSSLRGSESSLHIVLISLLASCLHSLRLDAGSLDLGCNLDVHIWATNLCF